MTSPLETYQQYLQKNCSTLSSHAVDHVLKIIEATDWENPKTGIDFNNIAIIALIEASTSDDITTRSLYLELAREALEQGINFKENPLCAAHLALLFNLLGDSSKAVDLAFPLLVSISQSTYSDSAIALPGLVYLPFDFRNQRNYHYHDFLKLLLESKNGYQQSLLLLAEIICRSQLVLYNLTGVRLLTLQTQVIPELISAKFKLGIYSLTVQNFEGIIYLHQARVLSPDSAHIMQALYLAYRDLNELDVAAEWLQLARKQAQNISDAPEWSWSELLVEDVYTYAAFEQNILLAVEPSFNSIVTRVLIAEGDWFEQEMEFWRDQIQAGMTIIDVGANVGVYTFSAAKRVGAEGRVFAIEPFSGCVQCLEKTSQRNGFTWVRIIAGAASDHSGHLRLALSAASELNSVIPDDQNFENNLVSVEEVPCFSLDSLIEKERIERVDFLKIDAEGHEIQVLIGSDRLLQDFTPIILYENIAGLQNSNFPVAEFLIHKGYHLFQYQPFLKNLLPVNNLKDIQGNLNIIAVPSSRLSSLAFH